ncbi:hypothetical protein J2W42_000421 [Rhizobium tibeticum]|uniref:Uncharacterized protein n=1 Tax=Rhizobium tibeticum TaxID=501024 RepID=A0A1H8DIQ5_9HYPH|nr:hypothetical protein [Rhizobium tibeticum]MDP9807590.1 hypothetical protein [Rhizobium tibeticum]SEH52109.1 hypothetical protein RTCCBAU85039_0896 [Rhizobium tibeticum]SEN07130.1 hypothetical protein SAMN05216228_100275 [Rhizobium tibeticum]
MNNNNTPGINNNGNSTGMPLDPSATKSLTSPNGQSGTSGGDLNDCQRGDSNGTSNPTLSTTMTSPDTQQACR